MAFAIDPSLEKTLREDGVANPSSNATAYNGDDVCWGELPTDTRKLSEEARKVSSVDDRGVPGTPLRDERFIQLC